MTITLPDEMREDLEARAKSRGYTNVDEYARHRLEDDDEPEFEMTDDMQRWMIEMAEEGLKSGPAVDAREYLDELVRRTSLGLPVRDHWNVEK